ncbi:MAG: hypothetical protein IJ661_12320 [Lachnospiraceae bacterium]|nr:hypothetical protein [Lachnospiraceae bacterium]
MGKWILIRFALQETVFFSGYTIEGFYIVDDSTYVFKDHFYYNDFRAEICFQKLFKAEKIHEDIAILIDPLNPAKHKVRGIEWLAGVRESFLEYFE